MKVSSCEVRFLFTLLALICDFFFSEEEDDEEVDAEADGVEKEQEDA